MTFIERGTLADERVVVTRLDEAGQADVYAPAVMVVGEVVRVRARLGDLASGHALVDLASLL